jgi:hypothetical protein
MGIREILQAIEEAGLDSLKPSYDYNNGAYTVKQLPELREAISKVAGIPGLQEMAVELMGTDLFGNTYSAINFGNDGAEMVTKLRQFHTFAENLYMGLKANTVEQDPHSISIRLPDGDDLSQIASDLKLIQTSLSQVILAPEIGGTLRVQTWLPGSLWIEIILGTKAAVAAVGSIVWAALYLQRKKLENERVSEQTRTLEIGNDYLEKLAQAQARMIDHVLASEARAIEAEYFSGEENPERLQRIKYAIQTWGEMFERGAEVRPALNSPTDEKVQFPTPDGAKLIESRIKHLTNSDEVPDS